MVSEILFNGSKNVLGLQLRITTGVLDSSFCSTDDHKFVFVTGGYDKSRYFAVPNCERYDTKKHEWQ